MTAPRILPLTGVQNFRDMGGLVAKDGRIMRWGKLYRSGHLSDMTDESGMELLARDIELVIDFRSDAEKQRHPVRWTSMWQPDYAPLPIGGNAAAWIHQLFEEMASAEFPADALRNQLIKAFQTIPIANADGLAKFYQRIVAQEAGNILFHCTAGKDRTGIAAAFLQRMLGFEEAAIMDHFMLTNKAVNLTEALPRMAEFISTRTGHSVKPEEALPLVGVEEDYLAAAWRVVEENFGSFDTYRREALGLSDSDVKVLENRYLAG